MSSLRKITRRIVLKHLIVPWEKVFSMFTGVESDMIFTIGTDRRIYVTSSAKTCLMEEKRCPPRSGCFHTFVLMFIVETAQGANNMFAADAHE